jgi:lipid-A-disaccharide synthase
MLVLFPFEVETYEQAGIPVECVGHPLIDILGEKRIPDRENPARGGPFTLGLLPGSRMGEIRRHLSPLIRAANLVARDAGPERCRCVVIAAREMAMADIAGIAARHIDGAPAVPADLSEKTAEIALPANGPLGEVRIVRDPEHEHRAEMHLALTASGTATVENAILGVPTVIVYRVNPLTYHLARRLVRVPHIGMVNLIAEREICPELIQADVTPEKIARTASKILQDENRWEEMRRDLAEVRKKLGAPGASDRAAGAVLRVLDG